MGAKSDGICGDLKIQDIGENHTTFVYAHLEDPDKVYNYSVRR